MDNLYKNKVTLVVLSQLALQRLGNKKQTISITYLEIHLGGWPLFC